MIALNCTYDGEYFSDCLKSNQICIRNLQILKYQKKKSYIEINTKVMKYLFYHLHQIYSFTILKLIGKKYVEKSFIDHEISELKLHSQPANKYVQVLSLSETKL